MCSYWKPSATDCAECAGECCRRAKSRRFCIDDCRNLVSISTYRNKTYFQRIWCSHTKVLSATTNKVGYKLGENEVIVCISESFLILLFGGKRSAFDTIMKRRSEQVVSLSSCWSCPPSGKRQWMTDTYFRKVHTHTKYRTQPRKCTEMAKNNSITTGRWSCCNACRMQLRSWYNWTARSESALLSS